MKLKALITETATADYYIKKFRMKMSGSTKGSAAAWVDETNLSIPEKKKIWKNIQSHIKNSHDDKTKLPKWVKESNIDESIKIDGVEYKTFKFADAKHGGRIFVGNEGILGEDGVHITWQEVNILQKKFEK